MVQKTVLLITGPSGSGKTTLAKRIAENKGWTYISEDSIWGELYPNHESRSEEMHKKVIEKSIKQITTQKDNVVFEFLVYTNPLKIVAEYRKLLKKHKINYELIVLAPSSESILKRKASRDRNDDKDYELNKKNIEHQLNCLNSKLIPKKCIISDSNSNLEEIYQKYIKRLIR